MREEEEALASSGGGDHGTTSTEYDEFFAHATFDDLKEMADILGVTYQDHCCATELKKYEDPPPNDANVDEIIRMVEENNPDCVEINLNNIKGIENAKWDRLFKALSKNSHVESLSAANCDITDTVGAMIAFSLQTNAALKFLTLDSNSLSGDAVIQIIRATSATQTLEELRVSGQVSSILQTQKIIQTEKFASFQHNTKYLGNRLETLIADSLSDTPQLVKLGITMEFRDTLNRTAVALQKNLDRSNF